MSPSPLRRLVVPGLFVAGLFAVYFLRQGPSSAVSRELAVTGPTMGTTFNVKVVTDDVTEMHRDRLTQLVREVVDGVDDTMSTFRPESEIEEFNRGGTEPFAASSDILEVVTEAQRVARLTGGAFDVTVGPLVDIWGFGPSGATATPSEDEIRQKIRRLIPQRREGRAEDIANAVYFLASPLGSYVAGETIRVNGAYHLTDAAEGVFRGFHGRLAAVADEVEQVESKQLRAVGVGVLVRPA